MTYSSSKMFCLGFWEKWKAKNIAEKAKRLTLSIREITFFSPALRTLFMYKDKWVHLQMSYVLCINPFISYGKDCHPWWLSLFLQYLPKSISSYFVVAFTLETAAAAILAYHPNIHLKHLIKFEYLALQFFLMGDLNPCVLK